jgi:hypothetical protein
VSTPSTTSASAAAIAPGASSHVILA